jgi:hypothetical protein
MFGSQRRKLKPERDDGSSDFFVVLLSPEQPHSPRSIGIEV